MFKHLQTKIMLLLAMILGGASVYAEDLTNVSTVTTTFNAEGDVTSHFTQTGDFTNASWDLAVTWKSSVSWQNMNNEKGSQVGSGSKPATQIVLTGTGVPGTITSVKVNSSVASGGSTNVGVSVGGTAFTCNNESSATLATSAADYEFTGSASGDVVLTWNQTSTSKAIYIKSVTITYTTGGSSTTERCETPTFSVAGGTYTSPQSVSLSCATDGASIYYRIDGTEPTADTTDGSLLYTDPITVNASMTIKAIAVKEGMENSAVADATYTIVNIEHAGTEADPYTVADARAAIDANTGIEDVYATGIVSEIVTAYDSRYGNITYNISADGTTTAAQLEVYRGKSYNGDNFTSDADIQVGDVVVVYGTLQKYNDTYEFEANSQLVSLQRPASISLSENTIDATADGAEGTINVTYNSITDVTAQVVFYEEGGEKEAEYDWVTADINNDNDVEYIIEANTGAARTAYMKVYALDDEANDVYSELITISQAAYGAPVIPTGNSYVKVTSTDDITTGQYLIVYEGNDTHSAVAFNGGLETLDAANNTIAITIDNNEIEVTDATEAAEFTIDVTAGTIKSASGKYIGVSTNSNGLKQTDNASTYTNTFSCDDEGNAVIAAAFDGSTMTLRYNYSSGQERFRYYKSSGQQAIQLYKKSQAAASTATITLNAACHDADGMVYGTYSNISAFVVPSDLIVSKIYIEDGTLNVSNYNEGDIVPANTGVMVSALEGGDYTVTLTNEEGTSVLDNDNMLRATGAEGITADAMAEEDPACLYYRLTMHNGETIGFWWGAAEGAAFNVAANKAYLAVPAETGSKIQGFTFGNGGDATEIVLNALKGEQNGETYNLQGQKVGSEYKGIVIKNNKKYMVK